MAPIFVESIKELNNEIKSIKESIQDIDFNELKKEINEIKELKRKLQDILNK